MRIYGFKAKVKAVDYKTIDKRGSAEGDLFIAQALIAEVKRGRSHYETRHNISLYLTEEEFNNQVVSVGDIIEISDGVKFLPTTVNFNVYDQEKLKGISAAKIKTDTNGRPYMPQKAFAYHISAPIGTWLINAKFNEIFYWQFGSIKVPMNDGTTAEECEEEFRNMTEYAFYLDADEYEKVKQYEGTYIINGYKCQTLALKQPFDIKFEKVDNIDKWKVTMTKIEG